MMVFVIQVLEKVHFSKPEVHVYSDIPDNFRLSWTIVIFRVLIKHVTDVMAPRHCSRGGFYLIHNYGLSDLFDCPPCTSSIPVDYMCPL